MAGRDDTKALGLHGLYVVAPRRGDHASAHAFAEERQSPLLGWAGKAVLEFRAVTVISSARWRCWKTDARWTRRPTAVSAR